MSVRNGLLGAVVAVAGFVLVTVVVTELVSGVIEFSLFVGLPAGGLGGLGLGVATYLWLGSEAASDRRRGAALAAFGAVFLAALVSLVVVGDLRNSQALPIAGAVGGLAALVTYLWFRRSGRAVAPTSPSSD